MAEIATNPNDYKVVTFTNKTSFAFTPELGCMYDSLPIFGKSGASVEPGESVVLPYHIGNLLAKNLAKAVMNRNAPEDAKGIPTGVSLWVEEYKQLVEKLIPDAAKTATGTPNDAPQSPGNSPAVYSDKADVIAELEKRAIPHDKRKSKDELEKLLVS